MLAVSGAINRLYLLVHRGGRFTHKEAGTEVWIYDLAQRKRLQRLTLPQPVDSIAISAGAAPRLLALSSDEAALHIYDARTLRPLGAMEEMGYGPSLIMVHGD